MNDLHLFQTKHLPKQPDEMAPDGSGVRVLLKTHGGSMAHFELRPGRTSFAVVHRTVDEIWYVVSGLGEMWRRSEAHEQISPMKAGTCLSIPAGTRFQFRCTSDEPLAAIGVTMPPWPGDDEVEYVEGIWSVPK